MNRKIYISVFGILIIFGMSIFIKMLLDATNDTDYVVDKDYQSITDERFDAEIDAFNTVLSDIEVNNDLIMNKETAEKGDIPANTVNEISSETEVGEKISATTKTNQVNNDEDNTDNKTVNNNTRAATDTNSIIESNDQSNQLELEVISEANDVQDLANLKNSQAQANEDYVAYTGDDWIDEKINEHRDEISDGDIDSGLDISEQINTNIVYGLLEDGLTEEEDAQLRAYLHSVLSDGQYQEMKHLFNKYNYLLDE